MRQSQTVARSKNSQSFSMGGIYLNPYGWEQQKAVRTAPPRWCKNSQRRPYQPASPETWSEGRAACNRIWGQSRTAQREGCSPVYWRFSDGL